MNQIDPKNLMTQVVRQLDAAFDYGGLHDLSVKIPSFILNLINNPGNLEFQALPAN